MTGQLDQARIRGLIPHDGAMCLLDAVLGWDADSIRCTAASHRDPGNPLRRGGRLWAVCPLAYAAQAMALHGALTAQAGERARPGMLASVRDARCHVSRLDAIRGDLTIAAQRLLSEGTRVIYGFTVDGEGRRLAEGRAAVVLGARD